MNYYVVHNIIIHKRHEPFDHVAGLHTQEFSEGRPSPLQKAVSIPYIHKFRSSELYHALSMQRRIFL